MIHITESPSEPLILMKADEIVIAPKTHAVIVERSLSDQCSVTVGENAHVKHFRIHDRGQNSLSAEIASKGSYELLTVHAGEGDIHVAMDLVGEGASCRSDAVYALSGDEKSLISSDIRHSADFTFSAQLVKGVVSGASQASFEGGILIPAGRKGIDGGQQHRALLLSPLAEVKAVPKLEIYSDDVKCAHGSAIGALNEQQLYYLKTRGIPEIDAREILIAAFLNEVLQVVDEDALREEFEALIAARCHFRC